MSLRPRLLLIFLFVTGVRVLGISVGLYRDISALSHRKALQRTDQNSETILKSIVELARQLGMTIVAEGVVSVLTEVVGRFPNRPGAH